MQTTIHLEPKQVPETLRRGYNGTKFRAEITESVTIPADAGLWDSGSRDTYSAVRLADGAAVDFPGQQDSPFDGTRRDRKVTLESGIVIVCHSIFCGKDSGLRFFIHPSDAAPMLPGPTELSAHESLVLDATASLKSSYQGKDRYAIASERVNPVWAPRNEPKKPFPTRDEWNAAKESLIARGLLNRAGAITVAGRNARPQRSSF